MYYFTKQQSNQQYEHFQSQLIYNIYNYLHG